MTRGIDSAMDTASISASRLSLSDDGRIDADLLCVGCGYNLRGLLPQDSCPECATPLSRSMAGDLLRYAPPDWLVLVTSGMGWILCSICLGFLSPGAAGGLFFRIFYGFLRPLWFRYLPIGSSTVIAVIRLVGFWRFTSTHPAARDQAYSWNARAIARYAVCAYSALLFLALAFYGPLGMVSSSIVMPRQHIQRAITIGLFLLALVLCISAGTYAKRLAMRIPDRSLAAQTNVLIGAVLAGDAMDFALRVYLWTIARTGPAAYRTYSYLYVGSSCIWFIVGIWGFVTVTRYYSALRLALRQAKVAWR